MKTVHKPPIDWIEYLQTLPSSKAERLKEYYEHSEAFRKMIDAITYKYVQANVNKS